nr:hypothetical protein [Tanacetum cinerariifolium]
KLSTVSVFLAFGLTFAGISKNWGVLRILMISLRLIPLCEHNSDFHPMVDFIEASPLRTVSESSLRRNLKLHDEEGINEPASLLQDVSQEEACPTDSGFIADQDRATIDKSSTLPHDLAPQVTSPVADEGKINRLKERVKMLEDREGMAATRSGDDAPIKGRTTVLARGVVNVPTGSGSIPTASTLAKVQVPTSSDVVPTASLVFATATVVTPYRRRKGKEVMVESETPKKQKVPEQMDAQVARELEEQLKKEDQRRSEQIARDAEIARIHAEEELQIMIDGLDKNNETVAKYLLEYHQFASELPIERRIELITELVKDFRGMTFKEVEAKFNSVWKQMEVFIPMGSKEEAKRIKRKGLNLEQESAKKQKTSEEVPKEAMSPEEVPEEKRLVKETLSHRPPISDKEMELWVELSRLYEPDNEDQLWTHTQNFMHAPVEWKLYDTHGVHHVTSKNKEIFMLVEKDYPIRKGLALVMISYKLQVENYSHMGNDMILKIYKIANSQRQQGD